jgi:acetylornithine deacetylase/succinyl-diaminopimelate desuccinylase-like protein
MESVLQAIAADREAALEELKAFLRIPSVSGDPARRAEVRRAATWVAEHLRGLGCRVEVMETPGHPIVYGEWTGAPGRPTLLTYGHYDVQPEDPVEGWTSPPFEPTVREGAIYARGAADDKGQVFIHLKAAEAWLHAERRLPVNLKFLIEGEEEVGSPNLEPFVAAEVGRLKADAVVISDTAMLARGVPGLCVGLRGIVYCQVDLRGPATDLHSGIFGGSVANPATILCRLLAGLTDERGRVTIPGFYDDVRPLTPAEREAFARLPFDEAAYREALGVPALDGEDGFTTLERRWVRPTFEVNGLHAGFTGVGSKTVLPAKAMAKVSMRLVPDQDPEKIVEAFEATLKRLCPRSVTLTVTRMHGSRPWLMPTDHPAVQAAARALTRGFGREPVFIREGGSIPIVTTLTERLGAPILLLGFGLPDENAHAPDERLDLDNFSRGIQTVAYLYRELT